MPELVDAAQTVETAAALPAWAAAVMISITAGLFAYASVHYALKPWMQLFMPDGSKRAKLRHGTIRSLAVVVACVFGMAAAATLDIQLIWGLGFGAFGGAGATWINAAVQKRVKAKLL